MNTLIVFLLSLFSLPYFIFAPIQSRSLSLSLPLSFTHTKRHKDTNWGAHSHLYKYIKFKLLSNHQDGKLRKRESSNVKGTLNFEIRKKQIHFACLECFSRSRNSIWTSALFSCNWGWSEWCGGINARTCIENESDLISPWRVLPPFISARMLSKLPSTSFIFMGWLYPLWYCASYFSCRMEATGLLSEAVMSISVPQSVHHVVEFVALVIVWQPLHWFF